MNHTLNGVDISEVSKEDALKYCYDNKDIYIRDFANLDEGYRSFECLISILESDTIEVTDLPSYGMSDQELEEEE